MTRKFDFCVVGGGIVGLSVANALSNQFPSRSIVVLEKEAEVGFHQTGHSSGVIHSGLYYRPGSLKAKLCVEGRKQLLAFCAAHGVPVEQSGKIVVATKPEEVPMLDDLEQRGVANGLQGLERLDPEGIARREPHAAGLAALWIPEAGVVDFRKVAKAMAAGLLGEVWTSTEAKSISISGEQIEIGTNHEPVSASFLVNCAGLQSDRVARLGGIEPSVKIIPFRGEYYALAPEAVRFVKGLVYPVPDPRFPFLGVHFTRRIDGSVEVGPNAVLAWGREFYRGAKPNARDLVDAATYPGFVRLATRFWKTGLAESWRSVRRSNYAKAAAALIPEIETSHLLPGGAGVRAQAVTREGRLVDDFSVAEGPRAIHLLNAPSPAATAALAIGDHVASMVAKRLVDL